ncbi:MAG TPA: carbohydrate kinase [Xanthomonadaceae bacterium]|jgi:fructokinase|nr:carbohydrate kinase [Xanthomonadaceae bacterium]
MSRTGHIVCFGEALIDFHAQHAPGNDPATVFVPYSGGAPANVAVAIARLGSGAAFVGMLGADMFGDMLLRDLDAAGVDTRHVRRTDAANTALAFVARDARGERSFSFYRPPSADLLFREDDFGDDAFANAWIFHAGSCSLTEAAIARTTLAGMHRARAAGALVSFDINLRPALWARGEDPSTRIWNALDAADLVKASREELDFLAGPLGGEGAAIERLWRGHARMFVVTDGSRPTRWYTPEDAGVLPSFAIAAIDCTGAGDAFVGGLLQGLVAQAVDREALASFCTNTPRRDGWLRFAAACGALATTRIGSFAAMPDRAAVERLLETQA